MDIQAKVSSWRRRIYSRTITTKNSCTPSSLDDRAHCQSPVARTRRPIHYTQKIQFHKLALILQFAGIDLREPLPPP